MLEIDIASRSEVGARSHNEDDLRTGRGAQPDRLWFAVLSDGAGGHSNGATASDLVVRTAALHLQREAAFGEATLQRCITDANQVLNAGQQGLKSHQRMHATVVALWLDLAAQHAIWAHVGDSRLYLMRHGRLQQMTRDDSVVQQMIDAGFLPASEARHHPRKNQLLAALGSEEAVDVHVSHPPLALRDGDAFLLCSDGWWDALEPGEIERCFDASGQASHWLDQMAQLIDQRRLPNQDNYSAVAVWLGDPAEVTRIG